MDIHSADSVVGSTTLSGILSVKGTDYRMNALYSVVLARSNPFGRVTALIGLPLQDPCSYPALLTIATWT